MVLITKTWNELPGSAQTKIFDHYCADGNERVSGKLILERFAKDHNINICYDPKHIPAYLSVMEFTEEQWTLFLLKWA